MGQAVKLGAVMLAALAGCAGNALPAGDNGAAGSDGGILPASLTRCSATLNIDGAAYSQAGACAVAFEAAGLKLSFDLDGSPFVLKVPPGVRDFDTDIRPNATTGYYVPPYGFSWRGDYRRAIGSFSGSRPTWSIQLEQLFDSAIAGRIDVAESN